MRDPSGLKAAENTDSSWPRRTAISLAVAASQMRAVLSYDAVTMRDPSGLKGGPQDMRLDRAEPRSPCRTRRPRCGRCCPLTRVTMRDPSGLKAAEFTMHRGRAGPQSPWRPRRPRCGRSCRLRR